MKTGDTIKGETIPTGVMIDADAVRRAMSMMPPPCNIPPFSGNADLSDHNLDMLRYSMMMEQPWMPPTRWQRFCAWARRLNPRNYRYVGDEE